MWDDVIIGNGSKGNSAIHVFAIPGQHSISHNSVSYWVSSCILGAGVTIMTSSRPLALGA